MLMRRELRNSGDLGDECVDMVLSAEDTFSVLRQHLSCIDPDPGAQIHGSPRKLSIEE